MLKNGYNVKIDFSYILKVEKIKKKKNVPSERTSHKVVLNKIMNSKKKKLFESDNEKYLTLRKLFYIGKFRQKFIQISSEIQHCATQ